MSTRADVVFERSGRWLVARLAGEVDMTNVQRVREKLSGVVPNDAGGLVIDLSAVRYLDSAAIELVFELSRALGRRRQELRLALPPTSALTRLFELTNVRAAAGVHPTLDDAVGAG